MKKERSCILMKKSEVIAARREINKVLKESRIASKRQSCALCGTSPCVFCNSHSIPQFVLRKIAKNGHVLHPSAIALDEDFVKTEGINSGELVDIKKGVENSWTFHLICRNCDNTFFTDYEDEKALQQPFSNKMMAEIALKDALIQLDKEAMAIQIYRIIQEKNHNIENKEIMDETHELNIRDYEFEKKRAQKIIDKNLKSGYKLIFWKKLPYTVPYALQSGVAINKSMNGTWINDSFSLSHNEKIENLHIVVFPLDGESIIAVFYHRDDRKYIVIEREFKRITDDEKLKWVNYIGIKYSENICASPLIQKTLVENKRLGQLISELSETPGFGMWTPLEGMLYSPVSQKEIPNLLAQEYSLEQLSKEL